MTDETSAASPAQASASSLPHRVTRAITEGRIEDPFHWLGLRQTLNGLRCVVFDPGAESAEMISPEGNRICKLEPVFGGVFVGWPPGNDPSVPYRLRFEAETRNWEVEDAFRFGSVLGEIDVHLLAEGRHFELWQKLGAHPMSHEGSVGVAFAVWAPNARRVSVVGEFNHWDGRRHPMRLRHGAGIWEIFVPGIGRGSPYKFEVLGAQGDVGPLKADPVGLRSEPPPCTASIVEGLVPHSMPAEPAVPQDVDAPVSIYEVHLGSWRRDAEGASLDYDALAESLPAYASQMGFTHLEFMPVSEHPFTGSWGYQPIGLFAPTARFGDPDGFRRLVDACHRANLGVIVDWVPAHFPSDPHGLVHFDGTHLYEHADPRLGFHRDWKTLIYNYGRREVANMLTANALYWLEYFGVDGLRVDAVASMLYRDYSRAQGEWTPNVLGGRENLEAVDFLREVNRLVGERAPGRITIAEESTAWPGVSRPEAEGGLGFSYKWNMGWMHDTLDYMSRDPIHRRHHHDQMTFGMHYAYSENFVLPLSHDEVVHGKGSLLSKMPGDRWQRFANLRAYLAFMWTHPGKKLLFMGGEFGQVREWNHDCSLDWYLLDDASHVGLQKLVRDLNGIYREYPALHMLDCDPSGFSWIESGDAQQSVFSHERKGPDGSTVLVVCNMTPVVRHDYAIGVPAIGRWHEILNTDSDMYGGSGIGNCGEVESRAVPLHGRPASASLTLPPLATVAFALDQRPLQAP